MILVTLGTQDKEFKRLLDIIEDAIENDIIKEEVIVQAGSTKYDSKNMKIFDVIPMNEFDKLMKKCDILIFFLDGRVPDEGACVELGMAYAWNKICLGYKTDDRCLDFTGTDNLFIEGCMNFEISHNLNELKSKLECIK